MPKDRKEVEAALELKGFLRKEGDHHRFIYHSLAGKKTRIHTKTGNGARDIADNIISQMAKQCGLTNKLFGQTDQVSTGTQGLRGGVDQNGGCRINSSGHQQRIGGLLVVRC